MSINFKDRMIKRGNPQGPNKNNGQWPQQANLNRTNSHKDLYKQVTNHLSSQQFQPGDFRRPQPPLIGHKKRNSILEMQCQQDMQLPQVQHQQYYTASQRPRSMINSNVVDNNYNGSLFESKLHETKGELSEQIIDLEKRIKRQIERDRNLIQDYLNRLFTKYGQKSKDEQKKNFDIIVTQLNKNLTLTSKKQKSLQTSLLDHQQKLTQLTKQFSQYTLQTQQKIQKIMNSNVNDAASSMKKSFSRNMGNDYVVQLKSSIKDIPVVSNQLVQDIKNQINQVQQAIKLLKFQMMHVKEDLKNKTMVPVELQKSKPEAVELSKINIMGEEINNLKAQITNLETQEQSRSKFKQLRSILQIQQQNYMGINNAFQKAVNINIIPRIKKVEDQIQLQSIQKNAEYLKKQVVKQLESMPIIRVKPLSQEQKQKMQRMKNLPKTQQFAYMLDDQGCILDCFGNYLLDQSNQRIRLQQDQIYYLETMEGIQIKVPVDVK